MFGDRSVKSGADLLKLRRSPLFQEGVASSRLRRRPPPPPALTSSAPPAQGGRRSSRRRGAVPVNRSGVPGSLIAGLGRDPNVQAQILAAAGAGPRGGGVRKGAAAKKGGKTPKKFGVEEAGSGTGFGAELGGRVGHSGVGCGKERAPAPCRQSGDLDLDVAAGSRQGAEGRQVIVGE